jgi:ribonuclease G
MSKELVISAASHERRVAILEEGQLVEIYIERENEFALVGSIYKGKVTRVLPGMQSAFVDIGLDGDAFLYVSDVFENLEDYDHGHAQDAPGAEASVPGPGPETRPEPAPAPEHEIEVLPGESLSLANEPRHTVAESDEAPGAGEHEHVESAAGEAAPSGEGGAPEERQPDSNASAPQNFSPSFNPTRNYPGRQERGGNGGFNNRRHDNRGRFGRHGRRRGGRNLPPSKYASPQSGDRQNESHGYDRRGDNRGGRDFSPRRNEEPRGSAPAASDTVEEEILLPGESLAKYRNRPAAPAPVSQEQEMQERQPAGESSRGAAGSAQNAPRRSSGGVPSWLLAGGSEAEAAGETGSHEEGSDVRTHMEESESDALHRSEEEIAAADFHSEPELNDEEASALSSSLVEAKHEETQDEAGATVIEAGADLEAEGDEEEEVDSNGSAEEIEEVSALDVDAHTSDEVGDEAGSEHELHPSSLAAAAEAEADAAQESAEHLAALGEHVDAGLMEAPLAERLETGESAAAPVVEDEILLPGETRAPHSENESREDFPRQSARIGGNPRSRFQRPQPGRGRDRDRGGRPGGRHDGRPDHRRDRSGRPGQRFERRSHGGPQRHDHGGHAGPSRRPQLISEMLKAGQDVVVQIAKEPLGKKGARITSHVALPGRFLVYMPTIDHIGVSRKIASAENRSRLRRLVGEARGSYPGGFIVRTAAGGATDDEIRTDIEFLGKTWNQIKQQNEERKAPALLHRDLNLVERILRDYVSDDFTAIWIDSEEEYGKVVEFVSRFQPKLVGRVKLYTKEQPIFEEFGIQHELDKALRAKVWLKSGGYIVINHTEALVAIDVNTGKFVGKGSTRLEDTIVKTNLEAVKEVVRQIRLRDLGGIIVVDFIDMEERRNREKVLSALQQALEQDKAPSKALSFNEFGLVCITRKRTKQALERVLCQPCPYCTGSGMVKSIPTLCYEIQAEARKMATSGHEGPNLTLRVHPEIAKALKTRESMLIDELEQTSHKHIIIQSDATLHWEQYDIY